MTGKKYYAYFDIVRLIAAFLVIVNHTVSELFQHTAPSVTWWGGVVLFFVSKAAVPLFLMISGALLLGDANSSHSRENYKTLFGKRILRFVIALAVFSLVIYMLNNYSNGTASVGGFLLGLWSGSISLPYWYLYMLLGLLLCLPLLRKLCAAMNGADRRYFVAVWAVLIVVIQFFTRQGAPSMSPHFTPYLFGEWLGFFMLGYFFRKMNDGFFKRKWIGVTAWAAIIIPVALAVALTHREYLNGGITPALDRASIFTTALPAVGMLTLARRYLGAVKGERAAKVLREVAAATFGVYLVHIILLRFSRPVFVAISDVTGLLAGMVIYEVCVFAACLVISLVLRRVPLVKKIL